MENSQSDVLFIERDEQSNHPKQVIMEKQKLTKEDLQDVTICTDIIIRSMFMRGGDGNKLWVKLRDSVLLSCDGSPVSTGANLTLCRIIDLVKTSEGRSEFWREAVKNMNGDHVEHHRLWDILKDSEPEGEIPWILTNPIEDESSDSTLKQMTYVRDLLMHDAELRSRFEPLELYRLGQDLSVICSELEFLLGVFQKEVG